MILAAPLIAATVLAGPTDPRPRLVELARAGDSKSALALADEKIAEDPAGAHRMGLDFLRAHLLERLGRNGEANEAFAQALTAGSPLAPWARLRLAEAQERMGHPEVAAGLAATLLAQSPPEALVRPALELLARTLERGGDCRLLGGLPRERFAGEDRRRRDLLDLRCKLRLASSDASVALSAFLAQKSDDPLAWEAVAALGPGPESRVDAALALKIGLVAFSQRDFELALRLLGAPELREPKRTHDPASFELAYAAARSAFWLGRYREAADRFEAIGNRSFAPNARADALFQKARSLELAEEREPARAAYLRAYQEDTVGPKAGAALLGALRLDFLSGDEESARRRLTSLAGIPKFASETGRGAMFLAISDLVRGKPERAPALLALAERTAEVSLEEIAYWRGRHSELKGDYSRALDRYLEANQRRPFHPLAAAARRRLAAPGFAPHLAERRRALVEERSARSYRLAEMLTSQRAEREALRTQGLELLSEAQTAAPWLVASPVPVAEWSLWTAPLVRPDELLLALGLPEQAASAVLRHFPASRPRLGLTGAQLLAGGRATRRAIQIAEVTFGRLPSQVPLDWVDPDWLVLLYPLPWADAVRGQARVRGVDPALLAAVIREESRFDPAAISPASARGLAQFVLPTARRLAEATGLPPIAARDLHDPMVAIPLGAAYLAQLSARFQGDELSIAAAYNAGEAQVAAWRRYCYSSQPEELLGKIGFGETRAYATRVQESRAAYQALWMANP
jgi:soluble lytic murein transglycosylase